MMKKTLFKYLTVILILFLIYIFYPKPSYYVTFDLEPDNAKVLLNGKEIPKKIKLKKGTYSFILKLDETEVPFNLNLKQPTIVKYSFYNSLVERFNPQKFPSTYEVFISSKNETNYFKRDGNKYYFKIVSPGYYFEVDWDAKSKTAKMRFDKNEEYKLQKVENINALYPPNSLTPEVIYSLIRNAQKVDENKYILPASGEEITIREDENRYILEFKTRILSEIVVWSN